MQVKISKKATKQIQKLRLRKQFEKQLALFLSNPFHPSLDFKPLKGAVKGFYAFRINDQYLLRLALIACSARNRTRFQAHNH
jgi:mRNA-degrading endonuclease RelE of RelBE toxin-antitoxin system